MAVTVHQILNDAKRLVNRLKVHESTADDIIHQTQILYRNVDSMKVYNEDVNELNAMNKLHSRPTYVPSALQENKHILELQEENKALADLVEEHQSAADWIMSRYRQNITRLVCGLSKKDAYFTEEHTQKLQEIADDICQSADIMKQVASIDDEVYSTDLERLTALKTENKGLRELLEVSRTFGSLQMPLNEPEMADKEIQTENT